METKRLLEAGNQDADETLALLGRLFDKLRSAERDIAVAVILDFLRSGEDARTGLAFKLGQGGTLLEHPTLRVALLDLLGQLDITAAETELREWIDTPRSGNEWAIGLRNLAWSAPDGSRNDELQARFFGALQRTDWVSAPDTGFLEAFDLAPFLGGKEMLEKLTVIHGDRQSGPLRWAALLAMDRMLLADRATVLTALSSNPHSMDSSEYARAALMSRADIRVEEERRALESYLRRTDVSAAEASDFALQYPNQNLALGYRLFTPADGEARSMSDVADGDRAAMDLLNLWQRDPSIAPHFQKVFPQIRRRLGEYIESANRAAASGDPLFQK